MSPFAGSRNVLIWEQSQTETKTLKPHQGGFEMDETISLSLSDVIIQPTSVIFVLYTLICIGLHLIIWRRGVNG